MLGLINKHYQRSLLATGKLPLIRKPEDLIPVLEEAIFYLALTSLQKEVSLNIRASCRPHILMDVAYIQEVFTQLLEHAIQIVEKGTSIQIQVEEHGKQVHIQIIFLKSQNHMAGLESQGHLWDVGEGKHDVLAGIHSSFKRDLLFFRKVIEQHGGMLWTGQNDQNTTGTYTVQLPRAVAKAWDQMA